MGLAACAAGGGETVPGLERGIFHGRWWNYYERGTLRLAAGDFAGAESDFRAALRARSRDTWRARTYGLHFTEYFANRELGITLFHQGRYGEAESVLRSALDMVDTERCRHYLDKTLRERLARGERTDAGPPELAIDAGTSAANTHVITVRLTARDDTGLAEVRVNGTPQILRGAETALARTLEFTLAEGASAVEATALDLAGRETRIRKEFDIDLTGPVIGIFSPAPGLVTAADVITVEGAAADASGVSEVRFGDTVVFTADPPEKRAGWTALMPLRPGGNTTVVTARDRAGNETRAVVSVFRGSAREAAARMWQRRERAGNGAFLFAQDTAAAPESLPSPEAIASSGEIRLKSPLPDRPVRHNRAITVAGEVIAPEPVSDIAINGQPVQPVTGAPRETFSRRVPVEPDPAHPEKEVPVTVTARTASGTTLTAEVQATVKPVLLDAPESRMPVAALAFTGEGATAGLAADLRAETETVLFNRGRFRVLDRMYLQSVLTEQQLAAALADPNQAISLGRLTTAHAFLVAELFPRDASGFEVKARAISTETSEILGIFDAFAEEASPEAVRRCAAAIAEQMEQRFPRLSGEVLATRGGEFLLNWTKEDGILPGAPVLVVREEAPWIDETTGEVLAPPEYIPLCRGRVEQPGDTATRARAVEQQSGTPPVEKGMPAISM